MMTDEVFTDDFAPLHRQLRKLTKVVQLTDYLKHILQCLWFSGYRNGLEVQKSLVQAQLKIIFVQ